MFIRAQNTYTTETLLHPKSGITSLVLVPLPHVEEPVDDIGPFLYGTMIGSAKLTNHNDQESASPKSATPTKPVQLTKPAALMSQSTQYHGLFSSSPLSSPPTSDDGRDSVETPGNVTDLPLLSDVIYNSGQQRSLYNLGGKKYKTYRSQSNSPLRSPPTPPAATVIPVDSLYMHMHARPDESGRVIQTWLYTTSQKAGIWKTIHRGFTKKFGDSIYQVRWEEEAGLSWVKMQPYHTGEGV